MRFPNLRDNAGVFPSLVAAAMPKCPLCFAGLLSTVGMGIVVEMRWLLPLVILFLSVAVAMLWFRARRQHDYKPFFLGLSGAIFVSAGKFYFDNMGFVYLGAALLTGASIWNSISKKKVKSESPHCHC
jgi:mercuric ion transport protein